MCYPIICVYLDDPEVQLTRLLKRNPNLTEEEAFQRIQSQYPTEKKLKKSEIKIHNDEKSDDLERIVR
jgi:dephospho-CoA kinase